MLGTILQENSPKPAEPAKNGGHLTSREMRTPVDCVSRRKPCRVTFHMDPLSYLTDQVRYDLDHWLTRNSVGLTSLYLRFGHYLDP